MHLNCKFRHEQHMKSMKLVFPLYFTSLKNSFSDITRKRIFTEYDQGGFGKMRFLLISENEFFNEMKYNGKTSFMDFMNNLYTNIQP